MKNRILTTALLCTLLLSSCKTELEDFVGGYNTAYSESIETVETSGSVRVQFSELMPIRIKLFKDAQTNLIKGEMRWNYHTHVNIHVPLKKERVYEMSNFRIVGDTLEFSVGKTTMTAQLVKSSGVHVFGIEKKYIQWGDLFFLSKNPLYKSETSKMIYYKAPNTFNEEELTKEFYNTQISAWKSELQDPASKRGEECRAYINYLTNQLSD